MFKRLFRRRPGLGDEVTILEGSFAGQTGRISLVQADGSLVVVIDECCQPSVRPEAVRRVGSRAGDRLTRAQQQIERSPEVEITKQVADDMTGLPGI
jgi:ribosomal protein L24